MNGHFRARLSSKERAIFIISLFSLISWHLPVATKAYAETNASPNSLTFEIKQNQNLDPTQIQAIAQMDKKVALLRAYLQGKNSPLAQYTEILLAQDDWKKIIAISNSESTMGQHCYVNNCSGIFGSKGLRTYENIPAWIVDMQALIDKRYKNWTLDQMNGIYVYPRSTTWIQASSKVYNDLSNLENQVS